MQYILITHEVDDYQKWKKGFDNAADMRKTAGEISYQVLRYKDSPNKVIHYSRWEDHHKAKAFFESDEVKNIRAQLGVRHPQFVYLNELDAGLL